MSTNFKCNYSNIIWSWRRHQLTLLEAATFLRNVSSADPIEYNSPVTLPPGGFYFNGFADFNQDGKIDLISVAWSAVYLVENRTREGEFVGLGYAAPFSAMPLPIQNLPMADQ